MYGVLEAQFRNYFAKAERSQGVTGTVLLQQLERRLDNIVYRLSLSSSRREGRQLVSHKHFTVNGRTCNIASAQLRPGDVVEVRESSRKIQPITSAQEMLSSRQVPDWLNWDAKNLKGTVVRLPERTEMEQVIDEQLIVEFYSR
jgi:small subunit ribosomal protein S4